MKARLSAVNLALIGAALVAGVVLDRLVQAAISPAGGRETPVQSASAKQNSGAPASAVEATSVGAGTSAKASSTSIATGPASSSSQPNKSSLDAILSERDARQRLRQLQEYIGRLSSGEFGDALKRIRQITNSNERELASRLLIANWAQTDPEGALQFAASNRGFEYVAEDVFQQLAAAGFDAAMNRALAIPGSDLRYRALRGVLGFKADTDPRGAIELARGFGEFHGNESIASALYRQWAANDPQAAAAQAAEAGQGDGWRSPMASVVQTWAEQDPVGAANWALTVGDAQAQTRSIAQVMRQWTREDPLSAANWIHALESGASRDAAVAGMAHALASQDPPLALNWIATITDDGTRSRTLQRVSGIVMWRDPQNGAAMLQAAGLPADQIRDYRRRRDQ